MMKSTAAVALVALVAVVASGLTALATARQAGQPTAVYVDGTYFVERISSNFFDPALLSGSLSVPNGYGNTGSNKDVQVKDWIEFGWQNTRNAPQAPYAVSVDINQTPSGYLVEWKEDLGSFNNRGETATVTLASTSFKGCTISRASNDFPDPIRQSLSGNAISLTTGNPTDVNGQEIFKASWLINCPKVSCAPWGAGKGHGMESKS